MAHTHSPSDPPVLKKLKTTHLAGSHATHPSNANFAPGVLDHTNIQKLHAAYSTSEPFKHAVVDKLFQDELLQNVKDECMTELSFTEKETDIYKVRPICFISKRMPSESFAGR
jgi:hypothetical protein